MSDPDPKSGGLTPEEESKFGRKANERRKQSQSELNKKLQDGNDILEKSKRKTNQWADNIDNAINKTKKWASEQKDILMALTALNAALSVGTKLFKGFTFVLNKVISTASVFIKSMTTMPIIIGNMAGKLGNTVRTEITEVLGNATEGLKEFFDTASNGGGAVLNLGRIATSSLGSFQSVNSELTKLFGYGASGASNMIQQLGQGINSMGVFAELFAESTTQSTQSIIYFQKMTKGLGMSAEDTKYITLEAAKNGEHYFDTMLRVKNAADDASKKFGINRKRLSMGFFDLRKDIVNFGHLSEPALMAVVGKASQLGVSMESLKGVFSKFDTFESAASSAAQLQQAFGMNVDALKLIKAEDPTEIVEMFRQSMLMTGRSFDDLNRHEKSLMASHTGMSAETLKSVMNYRTLGKSFEEIKKIMNDQKPEERHIKAMKDMNSSVTEVKKTIEGKGFFENFADGVKTTIMYNSKLGKSYRNVSKRMEQFYEEGLSLNKAQKKMLNQALSPLTNIVDSIIGKNGPFSKGTFTKFKNQALKQLSEFTKDVFGDSKGRGKKDIRDAQSKWQKKLKNILSFDNIMKDQSFLGKIYRTSGKIIGVLIRGLVVAVPAVANAVGEFFTQGLSRIDDVFDSNSGMGRKIKKWLGFSDEEAPKIFESINTALKDMKETFLGKSGKDGVISRALNYSLSIFRNLGKLIVDGIVDNKDVLFELFDDLTLGFFSNFDKYASRSSFFSMFYDEDKMLGMGKKALMEKAKREGAENVINEKLAELGDRDQQESIGDSVDEGQHYLLGEISGLARLISRGDKDKRLDKAQNDLLFSLQSTAEGSAGLFIQDMFEGGEDKFDISAKSKEMDKLFGEGSAKAINKMYNDRVTELNKLFIAQGMSEGDAAKRAGDKAKNDGGRIGMMMELVQKRLGDIRRESTMSDEQIRVRDDQKMLDGLFQAANKREREVAELNQISPDNYYAANYDEGYHGEHTIKNAKTGEAVKMQVGAATADVLIGLEESGVSLVEADKNALDAAPIIREIAALTGQTGDLARLTKQDVDALMAGQSERFVELQERFADYLRDQANEQKVVVTIDGYAVTAHLSQLQADQHANAAFGRGKATHKGQSHPGRLGTT